MQIHSLQYLIFRVLLCVSVGAPVGLLAWHSHSRADFTDVASSVGLATTGSKSGGVVWADFNDDGFLDVAVQTNSQTHLYFSNGGSTFTDVTSTRADGLRNPVERSVLAADVNQDGYVDLVRNSVLKVQVFLNQGSGGGYALGNGSQQASYEFDGGSMGSPYTAFFEGMGLLDVNHDGWLDVISVEDKGFRAFQNPGDGTANMTHADMAALGLPAGTVSGSGNWITVTDVDRDGDVDLMARMQSQTDFWSNQGNGSFVATTPDFETSTKAAILLCDFDGDGDFDLFYPGTSDSDQNKIWLQSSSGTFAPTGSSLFTTTTPAGAACGDIDNDGDVDLYVSLASADKLYENLLADSGSMSFVESAFTVGQGGVSYGVAFVDYDRDGDLDLHLSHNSNPNQLWRNNLSAAPSMTVEVRADVSSGCPALPITPVDTGATLELMTRDGSWRSGVREINGGQGVGSQGSPEVVFGLPQGESEDYRLTIRFQNGNWPDVEINVHPDTLTDDRLVVVASDPDGDGIPTVQEQSDAAGNADMDGDGLDAWNDDDSDGDNVPDATEAGDTDPCTAPQDADSSGTADYLESSTTSGPDGGLVDAGPLDGGVGNMLDGGFSIAPVLDGSGLIDCSVGPAPRDLPFLGLFLVSLVVFRRRHPR